MQIGDRYMVSASLSEGWLDATRSVYLMPNRKVIHLVVRILEPDLEIPEIRQGAQWLIDSWNDTHPASKHLYDVETTRNTIFPLAWARRYPDPAELAAYYRAQYTK